MVKDFKLIKEITGKNSIFVVLNEGLLFLNENATAVQKDNLVAEPVESLVTV